MINFESWAKYQWQGKHLDVTRVDHQVVDWYSKESEKKVVCFIEFIDKPQFTYVQTTECYSLTIVENVVKDIVWVPKEIWINLKQVVWEGIKRQIKTWDDVVDCYCKQNNIIYPGVDASVLSVRSNVEAEDEALPTFSSESTNDLHSQEQSEGLLSSALIKVKTTLSNVSEKKELEKEKLSNEVIRQRLEIMQLLNSQKADLELQRMQLEIERMQLEVERMRIENEKLKQSLK